MNGVHLRVVPTQLIHPHEIADPARERRIQGRLQEDHVLRDPLLVGSVSDLDGYVLLDGTNRKRALEALGLSMALVQVLDYADHQAVELRTWCHAARTPVEDVVAAVDGMPGLRVSRLSPLSAADALTDPGTLAVLLDPRHRYAVSRETGNLEHRAAQLRRLVDVYEDRMVRVDCDHDHVEEQAHGLAGEEGPQSLVAFPPFTRGEVVGMAMQGGLIPAGITRHIILGGRALRVNLSLDCLALNDVEQANAELKKHLRTQRPRVYSEPTILFDS